MSPEDSEAESARAQRRRTHLSRAVAAADLADRILDRVAPLPPHAGTAAALGLYGEAAFWALTAAGEGPLPASLSAAFTSADPATLLEVAGDETSLRLARDALEGTFTTRAALAEGELADQLEACCAFTRRLIDVASGHHGVTHRRAPLGRRGRLVLASAALVLIAGTVVAKRTFGRDLAADKQWRASSADPGCNFTTHVCNRDVVDIFFHTLDEPSPWLEIDLGKVETFSSVTIVNRQDCCKDRAAPLAIEVSSNGSAFTEVARRVERFDTWTATFAPVNARFVRAKALRKTILHFERVSVR